MSTSPRIDRPFTGIASFLRSAVCTDRGEFRGLIAVMGFPFDEGSPFMPGTRFGPRGIREHSLRFGAGYFHPETGREYLVPECTQALIVDAGDVDVAPTNVEQTFADATAMARSLFERAPLLVVLGGDHSISDPIVRAIGEDVHIVHFDAHLDFEPIAQGLSHTNAHAFRHIRRMPHVKSLTQIGIRSIRHSRAVYEDAVASGNTIVTMGEFRTGGLAKLFERVPAGARCYVSIDIDVLDMTLIPGCVSGEPDGMSFAQLRDALKEVAERYDVLGFDIVEANPSLDVATGATSYLAAHFVVEFMGQICDQPRWAAKREKWLAAHRSGAARKE
ncbi:MAG TPA: arginase family protein [Ramlibacter sp.]|uniref:arginase family protein n=1 Tax=Ramlibacter sp. TaxID=1917967 RepID=UPI002C77775F|nr:arginase family protein [Ramlibacter sp.]HVZ45941.1 arginase family protein [Ramlibacter sp.]